MKETMAKIMASAVSLKIKSFCAKRKLLIISLVIVVGAAVFIFYPRKTISPSKSDSISETKTEAAIFEQRKVDIGDFGLDIPTIAAWVPIISDIDEKNETAYLKAIENGVALSRDLAQNPKENGSMFIFGHSKYYKDKPGNYKEIFKDLNRIKAGDRFTLYYRRQPYEYTVTESKVVAADDFSIRDATPDDPNDKTVTIMTCWPPGTIQNRWVVFARQI